MTTTVTTRDWVDFVSLALSGLLVAIGAFGVFYAIRTLKTVERQTKANEGQLAEVKAAGEHVVSSERAWLSMSPDNFSLHPTSRFDWIITNTGRSTAHVTEVFVRCKKYGDNDRLPPMPEYDSPIIFPDVPLTPSSPLKGWSYIEPCKDQPRSVTDGFSEQDVNDIVNRGYELIAYGFVRYRDCFGWPRESRFCSYYASAFGEFRINLQAPAEYHKCT
jgi:hypothetical protein